MNSKTVWVWTSATSGGGHTLPFSVAVRAPFVRPALARISTRDRYEVGIEGMSRLCNRTIL